MDATKNKNIILIDLMCDTIEQVMEVEHIFVSVWVTHRTDYEYIKNILSKYGNRIGIGFSYTGANPYTNTKYNLTYDEIEDYIKCHHKCSRNSNRENCSTFASDYSYYQALQFWLWAFEIYKIDFVFLIGVDHGHYNDTIPIEIARNKGIQTYIIDLLLASPSKVAMALKHVNDDSYICLSEASNQKDVQMIDYLYSQTNAQEARKSTNCRTHFLDTINSIIKTSKNIHDARMLYDVFMHTAHSINPYIEKQREMKSIFRLKDFYQNIAIDTYDPHDKFVFYALHFEPEASILNRTTLSNQLFIIQILSENLPDGWKLFVKEHPHQFRSSFYESYAVLRRSFKHNRSEWFYSGICSFKNTYLINYDIKSEKLITDASAVATINGTVILESIAKNKPILIFGGDSTIFSKVNDVFDIRSASDVKEALAKINSNYTPNYENTTEILSDYAFELGINTNSGLGINADGSWSNDSKMLLKNLLITLCDEKKN